MYDFRQFYINGTWVDPSVANDFDVINPATEQAIGQISIGSSADVDKAVAAAKGAFESFCMTTRDDRIALLEAVIQAYEASYDEMARAISDEMGAPMTLATEAQAAFGLTHLSTTLEILKDYPFETDHGSTQIRKEPIGVCGFITPWNWPINQITCKVAPALAVGCTMVLKPSEIAPLSGYLLARICHSAGVPAGVFNLVNGDGPGVGSAISSHPDIDMVSFTGSTRAGSMVAKAAADTVKRVSQELGGKSANIILADADFEEAVTAGVHGCMGNAGQSCIAPSRMLVPAEHHDRAVEIARAAAESIVPGDPKAEGTTMGPVVSKMQFDKIQQLIQAGIDEESVLVTGGVGKPEGLETGYFIKPTVFAKVRNDMTIAREEIFGPVLAILPYQDEEDAIRIANDSPYGLSGYVSSGSLESARRVAARLRTGMVHLNGAGSDPGAPFGGYKQSGNGREWGTHGFEEFLEVKAIMGYSVTEGA
ncbi:aldehyde dehydrogenase family protein [Acidimicrobium ferrooxidans]|nr:aldehyde dehydrogenase family protein [Acidimicrobium ferrooxidans]